MPIKNSHNSIEDAKVALSLAKFRIEILDNLNANSFEKAEKFDILNSFHKNKISTMPLDIKSNI